MIFNKKEAAQRDLLIAYKHVFGSEMGKKVLLDLMNQFHVVNPHQGDPLAEGQRSVVLHILKQRHFSIEDFDRLLQGEFE